MAYGDVWILGAGASAEVGAPTIANFWEAAEELLPQLEHDEREAFELVLDFWKTHGAGLNIEQFFGYVDSPSLVNATSPVSIHRKQIGKLRRETTYLIAKVITERLGKQVSEIHRKFVEHHVKLGGETITFNWDINLDRAFIQEQTRADYSLPNSSPWGQTNWPLHSLLKLHGSLNWKFCQNPSCSFVEPLDQKEDATDWFLGKSDLVCTKCGRSDTTEVLMIPPVLTKLANESSMMNAVWRRAFEVLKDAERVFIIGYSFPETDLQSKILIGRGLTEAQKLKRIYVVTRPKFGTERQRFEDRYGESLAHSGKSERVKFEYETFGEFVLGGRFR